MKLAAHNDNAFVLNFERGEELTASLLAFCTEKGLSGATFTGLRAADEVELAYYNLGTKSYERHPIHEELEILSITGNLGNLDEKLMLHMHGVFGRNDLSTLGGHIFTLRVSGACEIHLTALPALLTRAYDETTGLNLLCDKEALSKENKAHS